MTSETKQGGGMAKIRLFDREEKRTAQEGTSAARLDIKGYYERELASIKWAANGQGIAVCPFHDDTKPSLSVYAGKGLFNCHACGAKGNIFEFHKKKYRLTFEEALRDLQKRGVVSMPSRISKTYDYRDKSGKLLFQVVRYEPKSFSLRRPDGKDGWINDIESVKLVPYHLPEIAKTNKVYVVEGEKDADRLGRFGLVATCNPMGAGKWRPEYNKYFSGKAVRIIPDNDAAGRQHALSVARSLNGVASSIKIVELPGLEEKEDISDWFEKGGTKAKLLKIVRRASLRSAENDENHRDGLISLRQLYSQQLREIEWLVDNMLPVGGLSVLVSKPKIGKTTLARYLALCVARGEPFLGREVREGGVIYYGLEELKVGIKRHFKDMGAKRTEDIHI